MQVTKELLEKNNGQLPEVMWESGYPVYYVTKEREILCPECANQGEDKTSLEFFINWDDPNLNCPCGRIIVIAYTGED
ncbi:MAG: hypothetical protein ACYCX4_06410 [Bacillota bacterium]